MTPIPVNTILQDSNLPVTWLGRFWSQLYRDQDFAARYLHARGLLASQINIDSAETLLLNSRSEMPVLHRERWFPVRIRKSQAGTGQAAAIKLGAQPEPVLGSQQQSVFPAGRIFQLGGYATYSDYVTYPVPGDIKMIRTALTDSIDRPSYILTYGNDFTYQDGSLVIRKDRDPFTLGEIAKVPVRTGDADDLEVTLWATDTLFDNDYVYKYLGYVFGAKVPSTPYCRRILDAIWNLTTGGMTRAGLNEALGALYDVPVVANEQETVESVLTDVNNDILVVTDMSVYRYPPAAVVKPAVVPGAVVRKGDFLTTAIAVYHNISDPSPTALQQLDCGADFRNRVPGIAFPPSFFRARLQHGLSAGWDQVPILSAGTDANRNPKLWFRMQGTDEDLMAFWQDVWDTAEREGVSTETCFTGMLGAILYTDDGMVYGYVSPLDYLLRNFAGFNTVIVSVDRGQLPDIESYFDARLAARVGRLVSAGSRLVVIEQKSAGTDTFDLQSGALDAPEAEYWALLGQDTAEPGGPSRAGLTYRDNKPVMRWVPVCK